VRTRQKTTLLADSFRQVQTNKSMPRNFCTVGPLAYVRRHLQPMNICFAFRPNCIEQVPQQSSRFIDKSSKLADIHITHRPCASLRSSWSPASAICHMSPTVSSASSPQHLRDPCIFCRRTNSLEFTA